MVLAYILRYTVKEFKDMDIEQIAECIENDPQIHTKKVDLDGHEDGLASIIQGNDPNYKSSQEGTVYFDIVFDVFVPGKSGTIKMIINVEAQNGTQKLSYHIVTRGIYYAARNISSQKKSEFVKSNYQNIKKVYSIWICIDSTKSTANTITEYSINRRDIVGHYPKNDYYDLLTVVQICLSEDIIESADDERKLLRLLETLLSPNITNEERQEIVTDEFGIPYSQEIERSVEEMCNASQGIRDKALVEGRVEGEVILCLKLNKTKTEICQLTGKTEAEIDDIIKSISASGDNPTENK